MWVKWIQNESYPLPFIAEIEMKQDKVFFRLRLFDEIVKPRPKTQTPKAQPQPSQIQSKSVPKGLGLTLKSYGPPTHPSHPTRNF